ncbi:diheme cytochrome c [Caenispirillum bisanense]|uniref:Dihaem cytochrome c n=1 Tax=Caenispirillum bisanense TaxID=414052 RepID=A0A286GAY9_9PROT|nr:diheme cytochrome c [Caenispirillum bisanense]SOD92426.1 Dihaem cytochrome c [Caenispirillum bisanense]
MRVIPAFLVAAVVLAAGPALADSDEWVPPVTDALTRAECGDCHMAFQPAFLPARSWDRLMDGLSDHFGDDASLPAEKVAAIRAYLTANAGDVRPEGAARGYMRRVAPDGVPLRITENPAFLREHDFRPAVWQRPDVVTKSNCLACHRQADRGLYEDD